MTKKKGGKRMNKKQVAELLIDFFQNHPSETYSFKQIFKSLKMVTHPVKMLTIDVTAEMAWDDFITKVSANQYSINTKTQLHDGVVRREHNRKN